MKEFLHHHWLMIYLLVCYNTAPFLIWFIYKRLKKVPTIAMMLPVIKSTWTNYRKNRAAAFIVVPAFFCFCWLPIAWPLLVIAAIKYLLPKAPPKPEPEKAYMPTEELEFDADSL